MGTSDHSYVYLMLGRVVCECVGGGGSLREGGWEGGFGRGGAGFHFMLVIACHDHRREHLTPEDVQKNKAIMENIGRGSWENNQVNCV